MACEVARKRLDGEESGKCDGAFETGNKAGAGCSWVAPYMMRAKLRFDMAFSGRAGSRGNFLIVRRCGANGTPKRGEAAS